THTHTKVQKTLTHTKYDNFFLLCPSPSLNMLELTWTQTYCTYGTHAQSRTLTDTHKQEHRYTQTHTRTYTHRHTHTHLLAAFAAEWLFFPLCPRGTLPDPPITPPLGTH